MAFLDVALPWNCNVLSVKALEFQVWFGRNTFLWQTFSFKYIHAYLWFLMVLGLWGDRDWLNMVKNIFVDCWQVKRETDKKKKTDYIKDSQKISQKEKKKKHSVNYVKQNTHIRYSSYLTKLCLIFILARFALVLIPAIQFSISGTYC